jgi:hypothetical protein
MEFKIEQFGKDHWSTFAYAECCCVDNRGRLDNRRLRINETKRGIRSNGCGWNSEYGTRQKEGGIPDPNHDDIDCLDDLERYGLIEQIGTMITPLVKITDKGYEIAAQLRKHKSNGGNFATFEPHFPQATVSDMVAIENAANAIGCGTR